MFKKECSFFLKNHHDELCLDFQCFVSLLNHSEAPRDLSTKDVFDYIKNFIRKWYNLTESHDIFFIENEAEILNHIFSNQQEFHIAQTDDWSLLDFNSYPKKIISTRPFEYVNNQLNNTDADFIFLNETSPLSGMRLNQFSLIINKLSKKQKIILDGSNSFLNSELNLKDLGANTLFIIEYLPKKYLLIKEKEISISNSPAFCQSHYYLYDTLRTIDGKSKCDIIQHLKKLQNVFRETLLLLDHHYLNDKNILSVDNDNHGAIFTFVLPSIDHAKKTYQEVLEKKIRINRVDNMLCFHIGLFLEEEVLREYLLKLRH